MGATEFQFQVVRVQDDSKAWLEMIPLVAHHLLNISLTDIAGIHHASNKTDIPFGNPSRPFARCGQFFCSQAGFDICEARHGSLEGSWIKMLSAQQMWVALYYLYIWYDLCMI